ncbi:MAG: ABC transporter permease, partial [Tumebacillaceae bacterium]
MGNLWNLVQNETLKVLRKKRFLVVLGILLVLIPLMAYGQYTTQARLQAKVGVQDWRAQLQQQITETEHRMQSSYVTDDRKKTLQM